MGTNTGSHHPATFRTHEMATNFLTDTRIRATARALAGAASKKLNDGEGLSLIVRSDATGLWRFRYHFESHEKMLGLGKWPHVTIASARQHRDELLRQLAEKNDPSVIRRERRANTDQAQRFQFERVAREWHSKRTHLWTKKHGEQVLHSLAIAAFPVFGAKAIRTVSRRDVMTAVQPMIDRGAIELAARVRQRIGEVFQYAMSVEGMDDLDQPDWNPANAIRKLMPTPPKRHFPALSSKDVPELVQSIHIYQGRKETRLGLLLLLHTFVRPSELRLARWDEFDIAARVWRVPAERMKKRRPHLVPLSEPVVKLLDNLRAVTGHSELLFPSASRLDRPISDATFSKALRIMGYRDRQVAHSFRALASTWLNEVGRFNPDAIERQLAHEPSDQVRAAYNRAEYLSDRTEMMERWSLFVSGIPKSAGEAPDPT